MRRLAIFSGIIALVWTANASAQTSSVLTIQGNQVGTLSGSTGGAISAEVITESPRGSAFSRKHIGPAQYEQLEMQFGFSMAPGFYDLIDDSTNWKFWTLIAKFEKNANLETL